MKKSLCNVYPALLQSKAEHLYGTLIYLRDEMITLYTDGSCLGNPGPGGRAVLFLKEQKHFRLEGGELHTTNNKMELVAVVEALSYLYTKKTGEQIVKGESRVGFFEKKTVLQGRIDEEILFFMDSEYVRKGITVYLAVWQTNQRKTTKKTTIQHQQLRQRLGLLLPCFQNIQRHWVAGHSGSVENDAVDKRARKQALWYQKNG